MRIIVHCFLLLQVFISSSVVFADIVVSPKEVIQYALKYGVQYQNIKLDYLANSQVSLEEIAKYDFQFESDINYQISQAESLSVFSNLEDRTLNYSLGVSKKLSLGAELKSGYSRISQSSTLSAYQQSQGSPSKMNLDKLYFNLSFDLWKNSFGKSDQFKLSAAETTATSTQMTFLEDTEGYILNILGLYWEAYVAKEKLKQSLASRERLEKLVKSVQKKDSLGYSNPGELEQVMAEHEEVSQTVKLNSHAYLTTVALFAQKLKIEINGEVEFKVDPLLPDLPLFPETESKNLRTLQIAQLKSQASSDEYHATLSETKPDLSLDINSTITGADRSTSKSLSEMFGATRPVYYAGLSLNLPLGTTASDAARQRARSQQVKDLNVYRDLTEEIEIKKIAAKNKVIAHYEVAKSAIRAEEQRLKMIKKMETAYSQGRSDIDALINAYNSFFTSETKKIRAIGDYHISLNELAALHDQLITSSEVSQ